MIGSFLGRRFRGRIEFFLAFRNVHVYDLLFQLLSFLVM